MKQKPILKIKRYEYSHDGIFGYATFTDKNYRICLQSLENYGMHIPSGTYQGIKTHSPRFGVNLYLIPVDGRQGIRIHSANWGNELKGCIALGISRKENMITNSKRALSHFHALSKGQELIIIIEDEKNSRNFIKKVLRKIIRLVIERIRKTNQR